MAGGTEGGSLIVSERAHTEKDKLPIGCGDGHSAELLSVPERYGFASWGDPHRKRRDEERLRDA